MPVRNGNCSASHREKISEGQRRAWQRGRLNGSERPIGATWIDAGGYVRVKVVKGKGRWALQHVLTMEQMLGRNLS